MPSQTKADLLKAAAMAPSDFAMAKLLVLFDDGHSVCTNCVRRQWYTLTEGLWYCHDGDQLFDTYRDVCDAVLASAKDSHKEELRLINSEADERSSRKEHQKCLRKLAALDSNSKTKNVISMASRMLYDGKFVETLDQNLDLIGLGGGQVYDLKKGLARATIPSDRVSLSTNISLQEVPEQGHCSAVLRFISDIFDGNCQSIDYVLKMLASMCDGHTSDELFHVLIGTGANGKSKLQELMRLTLGSYYCTVPCTLFTGRRGGAQGATAAFEHLANKRAVFVQEPERGQRMNGGVLKELSGGDTIYSRGLFKSGREFKPQAKFVLVSNTLPDVQADDAALWRRLRAIPFEITFKAKLQGNREKKRDDKLSRKLVLWAPAFLHLLLTRYYPRYKKEGITDPPPAVLRSTSTYRKESCPLTAFCDENIQEAEQNMAKKQECVQFNVLVEKVRQHYRDATKRCPSQKKLEAWFEGKWGEMNALERGRGWEQEV